jgi:hypothetical protein
VARRKPPGQGKTRTREHVLADLAFNAVERIILLRGYTFDPLIHDYGYDGAMFVYNALGEVESGVAFVQVKAADRVERLQDEQAIAVRLERADLQRWLIEPMPVILCLYEAVSDSTNWLYVQNYYQTLPDFNLFALGTTTTAHIPTRQVWTPEAVEVIAEAVRRLVNRFAGANHV